MYQGFRAKQTKMQKQRQLKKQNGRIRAKQTSLVHKYKLKSQEPNLQNY
jgi:hypothetical protein